MRLRQVTHQDFLNQTPRSIPCRLKAGRRGRQADHRGDIRGFAGHRNTASAQRIGLLSAATPMDQWCAARSEYLRMFRWWPGDELDEIRERARVKIQYWCGDGGGEEGPPHLKP
jgi:hypothetical protein